MIFENFIFQWLLTIESSLGISISQCSHGDVAELVDALDLGSSVLRRGGSSPSIPTKPYEVYKWIVPAFSLFYAWH